MLQLQEPKEKSKQELKKDDGRQFCWGPRKGAVRLYESFTLDGIVYSLYDCVYMWRNGEAEPDIGMLVRIWETMSLEKRVETVWFFRPTEISHWLGDVKPFQREIFLACGQGKGLSSLNSLEAISGKCNVVCSSKDERNCQPTQEELRVADYIFYRTFDVGEHIISDEFPSTIGGYEVYRFFNQRKHPKSSACESKEKLKARSGNADTFSTCKMEKPMREMKDARSDRVEKGFMVQAAPVGRQAGAKLKRSENFLSASPSYVGPLKKRKLLGKLAEGPRDDAKPDPEARVSRHENVMSSTDSYREKKSLSTRAKLDEKPSMFAEKGASNKHHVNTKTSQKFAEVLKRPDTESSKWFKLQYWDEERLREAHEKGTLVLLENLDLSFTSAEVEDIVWHAFGQNAKAKMVQLTAFSSPHSGQALTIFKSKEVADNVLSQLINGCLILGDGRPIVGRRGPHRKPGLSNGLFGHLSIDRVKAQRQRKDIREAVSTSHFSQFNTVEYEMAGHWCLLQAKSDSWWTALYEQQGKEMEALMKQMNIHLRKEGYMRTELK